MLLMTRRLFTLFLGPSATTTSVVQLGLLQLGLLPVTPEEGVSVSIQHMLGAILLVPH